MASAVIEEIERLFGKCSPEDQLLLIRRLSKQLRARLAHARAAIVVDDFGKLWSAQDILQQEG